MTKGHLKKGKRKWFLMLIILVILAGISYGGYMLLKKTLNFESQEIIKYTSSGGEQIPLFDEEFKEITKVYRGEKITTYNEFITNSENKKYVKIKYDEKTLYISEDSLVKDKDSVIKEDKIYIRTPATLYNDIDSGTIAGLAKKGDELPVLGFDSVNDIGQVNVYKVQSGEEQVYIYGKYTLLNKDEALKNYEPHYATHSKRKDIYSGVGGAGSNLDFFPIEKPKFENNVMPEKVYAIYLNGGSNVIRNIDAYLEFAKSTKFNAFVVDIKDANSPAYKSKVYEIDSPTNYKYGNNSFDSYRQAIKKIKDAGYYVIGRITAFKDDYYVNDNLDTGIMDKRTNKPFETGGMYWPSPYQRKVWEFNVNLAKEAVTEMGFNEIQFDYVRFPDRVVGQEKTGHLDFKNTYNEEKAQAIQNFLMYACDELHKLNVYVSADVFGESANTYVTAYGQYWGAISNVVDAISGMPYPDHFAENSYGLAKPWEQPYQLMNSWAKDAATRQTEIPTPAIVRTWVLSQNTIKGFNYTAEHVEAQIKGLVDAGLTGGYMTWSSSSGLDGYKNRQNAFIKEY